MKASESLIALYNVINKMSGPIEAKKLLSTAVYNVVCDLQDEGLEVSQQNLDERLAKVANDFITVTKNKNDVA